MGKHDGDLKGCDRQTFPPYDEEMDEMLERILGVGFGSESSKIPTTLSPTSYLASCYMFRSFYFLYFLCEKSWVNSVKYVQHKKERNNKVVQYVRIVLIIKQ